MKVVDNRKKPARPVSFLTATFDANTRMAIDATPNTINRGILWSKKSNISARTSLTIIHYSTKKSGSQNCDPDH
jgi:hypothetical protein